tara:strand:+ start:471 stop:701 length:231 start_codon:yes stop_codon:yes gene_type:complete
MKYEVYSCRWDVNESLYTSFDAETDEEAVGRFREIVAEPSNAWETMRMIQVVVERKTKAVASLNRMSGGDGKVKVF